MLVLFLLVSSGEMEAFIVSVKFIKEYSIEIFKVFHLGARVDSIISSERIYHYISRLKRTK